MAGAGRSGDGRFAAGNPGGPGRPRRATEVEYLAALCDAVSAERFRELCETTLQFALQGDPKAREWLGRYLLSGAPTLADLAWADAAERQATEAAANLPPSAYRLVRRAIQ